MFDGLVDKRKLQMKSFTEERNKLLNITRSLRKINLSC